MTGGSANRSRPRPLESTLPSVLTVKGGHLVCSGGPCRCPGLALSLATLLGLAYGTRVETPMPGGSPRQRASAAQGAGAHSPLWPTAAGTDRKRNPPRHRPAEAVAAPGAALEPGMAAARTLTGSQAQPGGHSPCPCIKTPYIPLSGGYAFVLGRRSVRRPRRMDRSVERHVNASLATFGLAEPTTLDAGAVTGRYRASAVTRESSRKTSAPCPNSRAVINEWPRAAPMPSTAA